MKKENNDFLNTSSISVHNAGLVLLANYVPMLLTRLGLLIENKFKDEKAQADAALYLQYLVSGMSHAKEQALQLNKILCGMQLHHSAHLSSEITEEQKQLMDSLIQAAIGYWPAIGTSSIDGFRGNWLVRDGLLTEQNDKWELMVEKRAYDLLINQSPFSFSIIKFAWMGKPLQVVWPY